VLPPSPHPPSADYAGPVRLTDFWARMRSHFGESYADSLARDHVMAGLDGRTATEALEAGVDTKAVWRAVCDEFGLPARER
jgi:hypothetical protein